MALAVVAVSVAMLAGAACEEGAEEATPTPAATATATATATAPPTAPVASPSPAATPTAAPETPTPAPTPTPSPTPELVACPDDDPTFCAFAGQVERAIAERDPDFFVANSLTESFLCTAEEAEVGYLCGPEQIGETITGVAFGWEASEGTLVPPDDYREMWVRIFALYLPTVEDAEGSGELRIWGLSYPVPPAEGTPRNVVVTYIADVGAGPEREAISLRCELADGQWQIKSLLQHALILGLPRETAPEWRDWPQ
jgi:hypothetical protein